MEGTFHLLSFVGIPKPGSKSGDEGPARMAIGKSIINPQGLGGALAEYAAEEEEEEVGGAGENADSPMADEEEAAPDGK